jgi:hypothetical protein
MIKQRNKPIKLSFVQNNYHSLSAPEMAIQLGVSVEYVHRMCNQLGVKPLKVYVKSEKIDNMNVIDDFILDNQEMKAVKIAQKLGVKIYLVHLRRRALGLTNKGESKVVANESEFFNVDEMAWVI